MKETLVFGVTENKIQLFCRAAAAIAVGGFVTQVLKYNGCRNRTVPGADGWTMLNLDDSTQGNVAAGRVNEAELEQIAPVISLFADSITAKNVNVSPEAADAEIIDVVDIPKGPHPAARLSVISRLIDVEDVPSSY